MKNNSNTENIQQFFATISPWESAYNHIGLSYLAIRKNKVLNLIQGRLFLLTSPPNIPRSHFQTGRVLSGFFTLSELGLTYRDLILKIAKNARIETPVGELIFPLEGNSSINSTFVPFHKEGIQAGNRLSVLLLSGARRDHYIQQPEIDWELKAAPEPFDVIDELLLEYSLGGPHNEFVNFEVIAMNVAAIALDSRVEGEEAAPSILSRIIHQ